MYLYIKTDSQLIEVGSLAEVLANHSEKIFENLCTHYKLYLTDHDWFIVHQNDTENVFALTKSREVLLSRSGDRQTTIGTHIRSLPSDVKVCTLVDFKTLPLAVFERILQYIKWPRYIKDCPILEVTLDDTWKSKLFQNAGYHSKYILVVNHKSVEEAICVYEQEDKPLLGLLSNWIHQLNNNEMLLFRSVD
jgi:hypothetical protein